MSYHLSFLRSFFYDNVRIKSRELKSTKMYFVKLLDYFSPPWYKRSQTWINNDHVNLFKCKCFHQGIIFKQLYYMHFTLGSANKIYPQNVTSFISQGQKYLFLISYNKAYFYLHSSFGSNFLPFSLTYTFIKMLYNRQAIWCVENMEHYQ